MCMFNKNLTYNSFHVSFLSYYLVPTRYLVRLIPFIETIE